MNTIRKKHATTTNIFFLQSLSFNEYKPVSHLWEIDIGL